MAYTYILQSLKNGRYYIGSTRNLNDRLKRHLDGRSKATKYLQPLQLVYLRKFETYKEAYQFEFYIKKQKSKKFIENLIKENLEKTESQLKI
jgi:putative endonuclease